VADPPVPDAATIHLLQTFSGLSFCIVLPSNGYSFRIILSSDTPRKAELIQHTALISHRMLTLSGKLMIDRQGKKCFMPIPLPRVLSVSQESRETDLRYWPSPDWLLLRYVPPTPAPLLNGTPSLLQGQDDSKLRTCIGCSEAAGMMWQNPPRAHPDAKHKNESIPRWQILYLPGHTCAVHKDFVMVDGSARQDIPPLPCQAFPVVRSEASTF